MKDVRLNNGVMMPAIGFGVFQIPENETERVVTDAIEVGYRLIDTASAYFNEEQVGSAIRRSGIKREEFFITTKLWVQDYEYDDALRALLETHPFFQQQAANTFLQQEGIQHEAWAPFAEGQNDIFNHPVLKEIAARHGKGVGAVVLRWLNQRNIVVIPKTVRKERMIENLNIFDFILTDEEMKAIAGLDTRKSPIYDDMDLPTVRAIGTHKIHD